MNYEGTLTIKVNIFEVRQFDRKSGERGQEVIVQTDRGYRCQIEAVDVSKCDLTGVKGEHRLFIEPITGYDRFVTKDGKQYSKNFASFRIIDILD